MIHPAAIAGLVEMQLELVRHYMHVDQNAFTNARWKAFQGRHIGSY